MNKELIEAFTVRYGWSPQAVLSMPTSKVDEMSDEELETYFSALLELSDNFVEINTHSIVDDNIVCTSEKDW